MQILVWLAPGNGGGETCCGAVAVGDGAVCDLSKITSPIAEIKSAPIVVEVPIAGLSSCSTALPSEVNRTSLTVPRIFASLDTNCFPTRSSRLRIAFSIGFGACDMKATLATLR